MADYMWNNPGEIAGNGIDDDNNGYIDDVHGWNFHAASENDFVFGGIWPGFGNGNSSDNSSDSNGNNTYYNQNSEDEDSHATHCAGVIAAKENGKGVVGIAHQQNVEIMTVKVLGGSDGSGTTESVVKGIQYAAENGANICNLSLGSAEDDQTLKSVIEDNKDMLFCVAAGNGDYNNYQGYSMDASNAIKEYPACYDFDNIITAANVQCDGNLHYTSNYGLESVDIAAPGAQIYSTSTVSGGYEYMTGTSMAAPMVSGIAALLYSYYDNVSAIDVKNMILNSARKLSSLDGKVVCGGMADAYAALQKKNTASETPIVIGTTAPNTNAPVVTPRPRPTTTAKITATPTTTAPTATAQTTTNPETTAGPSQQPQGTALPGKEPTWGYNDPYMDWWDEFWNSIFGEEPSESAGPLPTPVPITTGQPSASAVPGTTGQPSVSETPGATGQPVLPTIPSTTWEPVLPTMPSTTWKPVLPTMPGTTWEPVLPTMPGTTWKPVLPTMPSATEKPAASAAPIPTTVPTAGNTENPEPVSTPEQTIQVPTETPVVSQTPDIAVPTNTPAVSQAPASAPTNAPDGTASLGTEKEENINNKKVLLTKSKTLQMMVYHLPENVTVTWKSSDSSVVSVTQKGVVKAKAPGMAEITAKLSNGKKLTCTFIIRPAALKKVKAAQVKKKLKVCISWEKQAGVDGYRISRATSKNGKYKVLKTVNKTSTKSYMDTTVKGKTYYYKVCAYKKLSDGTKVYSVLSSACKVKVKK